MINFTLLFRGIFIGFVMCLPVGPIGVLCIQRTLTDGPRVGLASGLGAATADAIYCAIAELGISFVIGFINSNHSWLRVGGGTLLLFLGIKTFIANPGVRNLAKPKTSCLPVAYVSIKKKSYKPGGPKYNKNCVALK